MHKRCRYVAQPARAATGKYSSSLRQQGARTGVQGDEGEQARVQLGVGGLQEALEQRADGQEILRAVLSKREACGAILEVVHAHGRGCLVRAHTSAGHLGLFRVSGFKHMCTRMQDYRMS